MNTASEAAANARVSFEVPKDFKVPLRVDVDSPNPPYQAMREVGKQKFSELIVRVDGTIRLDLFRDTRSRTALSADAANAFVYEARILAANYISSVGVQPIHAAGTWINLRLDSHERIIFTARVESFLAATKERRGRSAPSVLLQ